LKDFPSAIFRFALGVRARLPILKSAEVAGDLILESVVPVVPVVPTVSAAIDFWNLTAKS
jgi:hypothetical protein